MFARETIIERDGRLMVRRTACWACDAPDGERHDQECPERRNDPGWAFRAYEYPVTREQADRVLEWTVG